jgi:PTS system nitrogen regulatory IIA component
LRPGALIAVVIWVETSLHGNWNGTFMDIGDWLDRTSIVYRSSADSKRQALSAAADAAAKMLKMKASEVLDALMERESLGSTGVGRGVAVPHARLAGLDRMRAVLVRLDKPVAFDAVDGQPVDLLFVLLAPEQSESEHLRALARVSRLFRQSEVREQLRQARTPDALHAILSRTSEASAA